MNRVQRLVDKGLVVDAQVSCTSSANHKSPFPASEMMICALLQMLAKLRLASLPHIGQSAPQPEYVGAQALE